MFEEAWTYSEDRLIAELEDMGVQDILIAYAKNDVRLIAALYVYTLVEAMNMPDPLSAVIDGDPWHLHRTSAGWQPPQKPYQHTHVSVEDGSPAMVIRQSDGTITLMNEDGHVWTDPAVDWETISKHCGHDECHQHQRCVYV